MFYHRGPYTEICYPTPTRDHFVYEPVNEGRRYIVTLSLIGWAHTENDPCLLVSFLAPKHEIIKTKTEIGQNKGWNMQSNTHIIHLPRTLYNKTMVKVQQGLVFTLKITAHISDSLQGFSISSANALEIVQSCTKPSISPHVLSLHICC